MKFTADLHIHSKYSRATAKNLDLENLYHVAQIKGIQVVGTGDFTYPDWINDIESKLEPAESGLFRLKKEIARDIDKDIPQSCKHPVRFILQTEISNIYKKDDRVRKNHNLIYFPDIKSVKRFNTRLDAIGNIKSDGRPILGLDAVDLLRLMLDIDDTGFFVPAHIWTPWFSMFGSKSGFDSMEECFGDLTKYIFAIETGLSSDPPMNWRIQDLDDVRLISSSDAHSPGYLGRNASVFDTDLSFAHIRDALEKNDLNAFQGTLDMYPHHGKYHYDGHRKCNVCLNPADTAKLNGRCPDCGGILTLGVLYRVQELATRPEGYQPHNRQGFKSIIPLADILSEIFQVGPKTKKVSTYYSKAIETLGPELEILVDRSLEEIKASGVPFLAEAIEKMRTGDVKIDPGYDGEFGRVKLFTRKEKEILQGERYPLFDLPVKKQRKGSTPSKVKPSNIKKRSKQKNKKGATDKPAKRKGSFSQDNALDLLKGLNPEQQQAVNSTAPAIVIQAGPGTGKTRTLTAKIASLISVQDVAPSSILALTFTNKAARELSTRIKKYLPQTRHQSDDNRPLSATFHSFCLKLLKRFASFDNSIADDTLRLFLIRKAIGKTYKKTQIRQIDVLISQCKQKLLSPVDDLGDIEQQWPGFSGVYKCYQRLCQEYKVVDFEDLIFLTVRLLNQDTSVLDQIQQQYRYIFIDEYQDLNFGQYELTKKIAAGSNIVVIGDPDQSIYGFRGSDNAYFKSFPMDFPNCKKITLSHNYRSTQTILDASFQMISRSAESNDTMKIFSDDKRLQKLMIKESANEYAEAVVIARMIEQLVGGTSFFSMDAGKIESMGQKEYSFSDFAILYRTRNQAKFFMEALEKQGIPFQTADKKSWFEMEQIKPLISLCKMMAGKDSHLDNEQVYKWLEGNPKSQADTSENQVDISDKLGQMKIRVQGMDTVSTLKTLVKTFEKETVIDNNSQTSQAFDTLLDIASLYNDLSSFLDELTLNRDVDCLRFQTEKVSLMTMHAAKGLEFAVVFVAGCEKGLIPFAKDGQNVDNLEEERRLFYVAMTRAMEILCLTYAKKRSIYGISKKRQRSFFIEDIERKLKQIETLSARPPVPKKETQLELF